MKRLSIVFALTALAAAAVAQAQQTPPPAQPPANATSQQQSPNATTSPSDPSANSESRKADKQALMKDCISQVGAANPGVPEKDIKNFCDKEVNQPPPPHD
jgi:uncharacterized protein involved in copper resistance